MCDGRNRFRVNGCLRTVATCLNGMGRWALMGSDVRRCSDVRACSDVGMFGCSYVLLFGCSDFRMFIGLEVQMF